MILIDWLLRLFRGDKKDLSSTHLDGSSTHLDPRSADNIATLTPAAQIAARKWLQACLAAGLSIKIIDGSRTWAQQDTLYAQGRTRPGPIVTNARGGYSWHNFGVAWDFGVFGPRGEYIEDGPDYDRAGSIARAQGLEWGGNWTGSLIDKPHVQLNPAGLTLAQMRERAAAGTAIV